MSSLALPGLKRPASFRYLGQGQLCSIWWLIVGIILSIAINGWAQTPPLPSNWIPHNLALAVQVNDPNKFSFAVFGDNRDDHGVYDVLLRQVAKDPTISFGLNGGDLVSSADPNLYAHFFGQVQANFPLPLLTAIGNHEISPSESSGRTLYSQIFGPFYYSFHIGGNYFIVVDDASSKVDDVQMAWLAAELRKAQASGNRFVFFHIPLYDPRGAGHCLPQAEADKLLALFKKYRVSEIFAFHIHGYYTGRWGGKNGIPYIITGGAGAPLITDPDHGFYHYLKVTIRNGKATVSMSKVTP